ncbi:MAG: hypothetical protein HC888_00240 [Candidatus Competibacteraceae bacterium]|nr:hypothetical protein [Candidatus Competibacteraceae bacterium]
MRKEYIDTIRAIFYTNDWRNRPEPLAQGATAEETEAYQMLLSERQGAVGIAILLAFLNGVKPHAADMSRHLHLDQDEIDGPFRRLLVNGYFSPNHDMRNDPVLLCKAKTSYYLTGAERTQNAYCIVAGVASGLTGLRED